MKPSARERSPWPRAKGDRRWISRIAGGLLMIGILLGLARTARAAASKDDPTSRHREAVAQVRATAALLDERCHASDTERQRERIRLTNAIDASYEERIDALKARIEKIDDQIKSRPPSATLASLKAERDILEDKMKRLEGRRSSAASAVGLYSDEYASTKELCKSLCSDGYSAEAPSVTSPASLCKLTSPVLANAALIADPASVAGLIELARKPEGDLVKAVGFDPWAEDDEKLAFRPRAMMLGAGAASLGAELGTASLRMADVALAALAKVVVDRAKRESLIWFLEEMHEQVCEVDGGTAVEPKDPCSKKPLGDACYTGGGYKAYSKAYSAFAARREIRAYWLPATCGLAAKTQDFVQYGGGADLLKALQGAVASDVRRWPGVAAGLGGGALFWATTKHEGVTDGAAAQRLEALFSCDPEEALDGEDGICRPAVKMRRATADLIADLQAGANAAIALHKYSASLNGLNLRVKDAGTDFYNDSLQLSACAMSLPLIFQQYGAAVRGATSGPTEAAEALIVGGLASTPACWSIVGQGWKQDECPVFSGAWAKDKLACDTKAKQAPALGSTARIERLSTVFRFYARSHDPAGRILAQWEALESAWQAYLAAFKALGEKGGGAPFVAPGFNAGAISDSTTFAEAVRTFEAYAKDAARAAQATDQVKLIQAAATLARTSLDLGVAVTEGLGGVTDKALYPGLCLNKLGGADACTRLSDAFKGTGKVLARCSAYVSSAEDALTRDWGAAVASLVATVRTTVVEKCSADTACQPIMDRLSRYSGLFAALVSERDPEKVAQALDAAAMPIGGWRSKQIPGTIALTVNAFPGFASGGEWRYGQYGVFRNRGDHVYLAAPTLQLPVGLDLSFATGWKGIPVFGIFGSMIDPAAYLQYDAEQQGRMPGAQAITALAPGVALHIAVGPTPLVLAPYLVYRPNFRAWDPGAIVPAANALQLGVSVSVDVSLLDLHTWHWK